MAEYIERETVLTELGKYNFAESYDNWAVKCIVKSIPSADVVEVVRCKDCTYWEQSCDYIGRCSVAKYLTEDTGYCVWGKRRDDDG